MGENIEPNWRKAMLEGNDGFYNWCLYSGPWSEVGAWLVWVFVVACHLFNKKDYKNTFSSFSTNNMDRKPNCEVFLHDRNGNKFV